MGKVLSYAILLLAILIQFDRLIKMSILAQFHQLAPPGMQKRAVVWVAIFVLMFTLFTVFVSSIALHPTYFTLIFP